MFKFLLISLTLVTAQGKRPIVVPYTDVGHRVQIVGRFGKPLGTVLRLEGHRFGNSRGPTMLGGENFLIDRIDGVPVKGESAGAAVNLQLQ